MIRYLIRHTTTYTYTETVSICQNLAHLHPRACPYQQVHSSELVITPEPSSLEHFIDYYGNPAMFFTIQEPHRSLQIEITHDLQVQSKPVCPANETLPWNQLAAAMTQRIEPEWLSAREYLYESRYIPLVPEIADYARQSFPENRPVLEAALDLTQRIFHDFKYDAQATTIATPVQEVFQHRHGVCQDFAHLQITGLRSLGIPARYVSGYLSTTPPPGKARVPGADESHAWLSVFCGEHGWIDLDPTNNQVPGIKHIMIGWGRDFDDVSPVKGVILGGGAHQVSVSVDAQPILETHE